MKKMCAISIIVMLMLSGCDITIDGQTEEIGSYRIIKEISQTVSGEAVYEKALNRNGGEAIWNISNDLKVKMNFPNGWHTEGSSNYSIYEDIHNMNEAIEIEYVGDHVSESMDNDTQKELKKYIAEWITYQEDKGDSQFKWHDLHYDMPVFGDVTYIKVIRE